MGKKKSLEGQYVSILDMYEHLLRLNLFRSRIWTEKDGCYAELSSNSIPNLYNFTTIYFENGRWNVRISHQDRHLLLTSQNI